MKRIYITNGAWTQAVDFHPEIPGDIVIMTSPAGHVMDAVQDYVECTDIMPQSDTWVARVPMPEEVKVEAHALDAIDRLDEGPNGRFMREVLGDDAYRQWLEG